MKVKQLTFKKKMIVCSVGILKKTEDLTTLIGIYLFYLFPNHLKSYSNISSIYYLQCLQDSKC